jgi:hypothetical protein
MNNNLPFPQIKLNRTWMVIAISSILLVASACTGTVATISGPTPTTTMGSISQDQQLTDAAAQSSTQTGGSSSSGTGTVVDICSLVSSDEAATVLGQAVIAITPGSEPDSISGSTLNFCTYLGSGLALVVSSVETGSAKAGAEILQAQLANMLAEDPTTTSKEEPGLGNKAYWSVAEHGVSYTVLTDTHVFSVALGGAIGDPSSHKTRLLDLAKSVASRQ